MPKPSSPDKIIISIIVIIITILILFILGKITKKTKSKPEYVKPPFTHYPNWNLKKKLYVTNPWDEHDIVLSKEGAGAWDTITLFDIFDYINNNNQINQYTHFQKEYPIDETNANKLRKKEHDMQEKQKEKMKSNTKNKNEPKNDNNKKQKDYEIQYEWKKWTYKETYEEIITVAKSLINLGLKPWESVSIIGFNAPHWIFSHLGTIYAGGIPVGIYTTNNLGNCKYIANESKTRIVICEDNMQCEKYVNIANELPLLSCIVVWNDYIDENLQQQCPNVPIYSWKKFIEFGKMKNNNNKNIVNTSNQIETQVLMNNDELNKELNKRRNNIKASQCCTVIYTSGTTGKPKGVMLSHDNIIWIARNLIYTISQSININKDHQHRVVSFLPLSHVLGQGVDIFAPIIFAYDYHVEYTVYFARKDAFKGSLPHTLKYVQPTLLLTVPQVYDKMYQQFYQILNHWYYLPIKLLINYALFIGKQNYHHQYIDCNNKESLIFNIINSLILSSIRTQFGLNKVEFAAYGGSPLKKETKEYFASINILLNAVFGLSEAAVCTITTPNHYDIESSGYPLDSVEIVTHKLKKKPNQENQDSDAEENNDNEKQEDNKQNGHNDTEEDNDNNDHDDKKTTKKKNKNDDNEEDNKQNDGIETNNNKKKDNNDGNDKNEDNEDDNDTKQDKKSSDKNDNQEEEEEEEKEEKEEILIRGRHVMMGYMYNEKKTKKAIDKNGYFHTGDLGKIDIDNDYLYITGREKDLIITNGGENIAPTPIEKYIQQHNNDISNCVVIGDDQKFLSILITLKNKNDYNNDNTKKSIEKTISQYNNDKNYCISNAQKLQKYKILKEDFSEKKGEVTPTMKIKRAQIIKNYKTDIDQIYK